MCREISIEHLEKGRLRCVPLHTMWRSGVWCKHTHTQNSNGALNFAQSSVCSHGSVGWMKACLTRKHEQRRFRCTVPYLVFDVTTRQITRKNGKSLQELLMLRQFLSMIHPRDGTLTKAVYLPRELEVYLLQDKQ